MWLLRKENKVDPCEDELPLLYIVSEEKYFVSHRLALAKEAVAAGYKVTVATKLSARCTDWRDTNLQAVNIHFERSFSNIFSEFNVFRQVRKCVAVSEPAIVHAVSLKMSVLAALCLLGRRNVRLICAFTGFGYVFTSKDMKAKIFRFFAEMFLKLMLRKQNYWSVVQNGDDFDLLKRIIGGSADRTIVIKGSGVDTEEYPFSKLPISNPKMVLFPARLLIDKGVQDFVRAARLIRARRRDAIFILAGRLDLTNPSAIARDELQRWIDEGVVEWLGEHSDMKSLYAKSTIVCLPSHREGLPKSLLEAAAMGRPIVTTNVPGCREVCRDKENGLLVPVRDSVALASAVITLLDDRGQCQQLGLRGRAIVEKELSGDRINKKFLTLYQRIRQVL